MEDPYCLSADSLCYLLLPELVCCFTKDQWDGNTVSMVP